MLATFIDIMLYITQWYMGKPLFLPSKTKIPPVSGTAILPIGTTILPVEICYIFLSKKSQTDTIILYQTYLSVAHFKREEKKGKFNWLPCQ